jgi:hypothetical protein
MDAFVHGVYRGFMEPRKTVGRYRENDLLRRILLERDSPRPQDRLDVDALQRTVAERKR